LSAPRTRGSTCLRYDVSPLQAVCPAYAGIDLTTALSSTPWRGLPRVRGDRPGGRYMRPASMRSAPRTRGSTLPTLTGRIDITVCPAYAGIDLVKASHSQCDAGLPRVRGDRPDRTRASGEPGASAPRTRGSTPLHLEDALAVKVCPAYAGIDPASPGRCSRRQGLPRVRGDRPRKLALLAMCDWSAPRTRGSTLPVKELWYERFVCPAYAGIDRPGDPEKRRGSRLPRVRGDRPCVLKNLNETRRSAPRTRGSTPASRSIFSIARVCPAYAGIDRVDFFFSLCYLCLPRVRGDRPHAATSSSLAALSAPRTRGSTARQFLLLLLASVCPAYAGIDRNTALDALLDSSLPRVRGDRP